MWAKVYGLITLSSPPTVRLCHPHIVRLGGVTPSGEDPSAPGLRAVALLPCCFLRVQTPDFFRRCILFVLAALFVVTAWMPYLFFVQRRVAADAPNGALPQTPLRALP